MKRQLILALAALVLLSNHVQAEDPVDFADPALKTAVEQELWVSDPTPTDMLGLTYLQASGLGISDITGLQYATNLETLSLAWNKLEDISDLSGLSRLEHLDLLRNEIADISPLSSLVNLKFLDLESNLITDISPLAALSNLESLCLHRNRFNDISPLLALTHLTWLDLRANPMNADAYNIHMAQIQANNPGITLYYEAYFVPRLVVTSTLGGSVIRPGEGEFVYQFYDTITLEAKADPGFVFVNWSGMYYSLANPISWMMDQDYSVRANFASLESTIYVDDDAPGDPGPGDPAVSDPAENGTAEHPCDRIQEAIEIARDGTTIFVREGTYSERIDLMGKQVKLLGEDPNDPNAVTWPVLHAEGGGCVVSFLRGETPDCELRGFVITGGKEKTGAAILCSAASPTIANCLIVGNQATDPTGAVISCTDSNATFVNCTIADNHTGSQGAGLSLADDSVTIANSILSGNAPHEILSAGDGEPTVRYSLVAGGWPGQGNMDADPLFVGTGAWVDPNHPCVVVDPAYPDALFVPGDYHLQAQAGRWDPLTGEWVQDGVTSPCIDAGNPNDPVGDEPVPNGDIVNIGAYGGTAEASKSPSNG